MNFVCQIAASATSVSINAGLAHSTAYTVVVIDKFGIEYTQAVMTDSGGNFSLNLATFPAGLFTSSAGTFQIYIFLSSNNQAATLTICGVTYTGIAITFFSGSGLPNNIPVGCP